MEVVEMEVAYMKRNVSLLLVLVLTMGCMVCLNGCATTTVGKGYDILKVGGVLYDTSLTYAGEQYRAGKISDAEKDEIVKYARKFKIAWLTAKTALVTYKKAVRMRGENADLETEELALQIAVNAATEAQTLLVDYMAIMSKGDG